MAFAVSTVSFSVFLAFSLFISGVLGGGIACGQLDRRTCAFAVSSSGFRCVLEKHVRESGRKVVYSCQTSGVEVGVDGWIESDQCMEACGLDRDTFGISSDFLLESQFMRRLCTPECYRVCHNIVDLYFNLAVGEGVFLPDLCQAKNNKRREMEEVKSSGETKIACAPEAATMA